MVRYCRYFTTYAIPEKKRADFVKAFAFGANSLSREAEFGNIIAVGPDMLRVDIRDFDWDAKVYERLADAPEPYFHVVLEEQEEVEIEQGYSVDASGKRVEQGTAGSRWVKTGSRKEKKAKKGSKKTAAAPWLPTADIAYLIEATQSQVPIVRADDFLWQTQIERPGQASYAEFLGLGDKEQDFLDLIAADKEKSRKVKKEIAAVMARSGVAINNRRIVRLQSLTGALWATEDFQNSVGQKNVLRFLDGDTEPPAGDAREIFGTLPNGLFTYFLQNAKGERQNVVPQNIALDGHTASNDKNIYLGVKSCASCHVEGLRGIDDYARKIFRGAIVLQSVDYDRFKRLRQLYLSDLKGQLDTDNTAFATALFRCNGLTPEKNARIYEAVWDAYAETDLTPETAALELGVTEKRFVAALKAYEATGPPADAVLASFLQDPPVPVRREQWREVYPLAQTILLGTKP